MHPVCFTSPVRRCGMFPLFLCTKNDLCSCVRHVCYQMCFLYLTQRTNLRMRINLHDHVCKNAVCMCDVSMKSVSAIAWEKPWPK